MTPNHTAVVIEPTLIVKVRDLQSLNDGEQMNKVSMDAFMKLCSSRDKQLNSAHKLVNDKKKGYIERKRSQFISSSVADILFAPSAKNQFNISC